MIKSANQLGKYFHLQRLCSNKGNFKMLALDQRPPIFSIIQNAKKSEPTYQEIVECKKIISSSLAKYSTAVLMDPYYSIPNIIDTARGKGLIITLEDHVFKETANGRFSKSIDNWSVEKIKRVGGDAVKVLAWYRPDADSQSKQHQQDYVRSIGEECKRLSIPFLLELLVYAFVEDDEHKRGYEEQKSKKIDHVIESVNTFSKDEYSIDIFKLESPVPSKELVNYEDNKETQKAFKDLASATRGKPWVVLSSGMTKNAFIQCLELAYANGASGYLAGRSIWKEAFDNYPNMDEIKKELQSSSSTYMQTINELTDAKAASLNNFIKDQLTLNDADKFMTTFSNFSQS